MACANNATADVKNFNKDEYLDVRNCKADVLFRQLAERLGTNWQPLATYLGIPADKIDDIKMGDSNITEQIFQMLQMWHQDQYKPPKAATTDDILQEDMKNSLIRSLSQSHRNDLAVEISQGRLKCVHPFKASKTHLSSSGKPIANPDDPNDKQLRSVAESIPAQWKRLATQLDVSSEQIDVIQDKSRRVSEQAFQMLQRWKQTNPTLDHRKCLIAALNYVGRRDVAEKLQQNV